LVLKDNVKDGTRDQCSAQGREREDHTAPQKQEKNLKKKKKKKVY